MTVRRLEVFAVDHQSIQLSWAALGPGPVAVAAGAARAEVNTDGGPGATLIEGLRPSTAYEIEVSGEGFRRRLAASTLPAPPGELLCRVATIGDIHAGERGFGYFGGIREPGDVEHYTLRSTRAAIDEAVAWGADLLVVKGDITHDGRRRDWETIGAVLGSAPVPVVAVPGNHDVKDAHDVDPAQALAHHGVMVARGVEARDLPGVRVVLVDTTVDGLHRGRLDHLQAAIVDTLQGARREGAAALVAMHHQLSQTRIPRQWPPGVPRRQSRRLLEAMAAARTPTLVTSGHTHRHRKFSWGPLTCTTVGSVKDYPGVWAGYSVHEGGISQVVRRVARPDVIAWTERSGATVGGLYRHWTPGRLGERCFSLSWVADRSGVAPAADAQTPLAMLANRV